jgi:glucosylglycerate synthase
LAEDTFLDDNFLRQLMSVGEVDLLVGVPSYNNAATIGQTVRAIEESLHQNFIRDRVAILNVDGGSTDNTCDVLLQSNGARASTTHRGLTSLRTIRKVSSQYANSPSPGMALRTILAAADLLRANSCAIVSASTTNLTPSWIANLLRPHRERFDFVAPIYARERFQGLLARELLYPMSRAIFGLRLRELYADEWGFSGRLASQCLEQRVWQEESVRARPEAWMGVTAICSGYKCCQVFLGPKVASAPAAGPDIVEAVRQTVGNLFWCVEQNQEHWLDRTGSQPVPTFGPEQELTTEGPPPNLEKSLELFRSGVKDLAPILASILAQDTLSEITALAAMDSSELHFGNELWVKVLYEFAASYHHSVLNRDHIVQALVPLYRGRLYSFLREHSESTPEEMERDSEALCLEFERQKPYLIERWNAKR